MGNDVIPALNQEFKNIIEFLIVFNIVMILVQQVNEEMDTYNVKAGIKYSIPSVNTHKLKSDQIVIIEPVINQEKK